MHCSINNCLIALNYAGFSMNTIAFVFFFCFFLYSVKNPQQVNHCHSLLNPKSLVKKL